MAGQGADPIKRRRLGDGGLKRKPFIDHQWVVGVACVEILKRGGAFRPVMGRERFKRRDTVGHIVGIAVLRESAGNRGIGFRHRQKIKAGILKRAPASALRVRPVSAGGNHPLVSCSKEPAMARADRRAQFLPRGEDRIRIDVVADFACDIRFAWWRERQCNESGFERGVVESCPERIHQSFVQTWLATRAHCSDIALQKGHRQCLDRLPSVEWVAIVSREKAQMLGVDRHRKLDRSREAAVERKHRTLRDIGEDK